MANELNWLLQHKLLLVQTLFMFSLAVVIVWAFYDYFAGETPEQTAVRVKKEKASRARQNLRRHIAEYSAGIEKARLARRVDAQRDEVMRLISLEDEQAFALDHDNRVEEYHRDDAA